LYRKFFKTLEAGKEAVWLLQGDAGLRERSVLYNVLKESWNNGILVFSSNPSYVSKGVLFSLYPDNRRMGSALASKLLARKAGEKPTIEQTRDLLIAVNIRTAKHLGLDVSRSQRREFDVIFPRQ
jgi:putative ABC transport system substrate-binding protein